MRVKINQLLKPSKQKIALFIIFMLIVVAGQVQSYAFTNGEESGRQKPTPYEVLKPFPLWVLWMYLLLPLFPIYFIFSSSGIRNIVFCYEKYNQKFTAKFFGVWIGIAIAFNLASHGERLF